MKSPKEIALLELESDRIAAILKRGQVDVPLFRDFCRGQPVACSSGCSHCCHHRVATVPFEILAISKALRNRRSHKDLQRLKTGLEKMAHLTIGDRVPCPLLDDSNRCSVYSLRPLKCATEHSLVASACETPHGRHPLLLDLAKAGDLAYQALVQACLSLKIDPGPIDLARGLSIALEVPDATRRWLQGERLFEPAKLSLATDKIRPALGKEYQRWQLPVLQ